MSTQTYHTDRKKVLEPYEPGVNGDFGVYNFAPNLDLDRGGVVMGQVTSTGKFKPFASGASDGTQNAKVITIYPLKTNADGEVVSRPVGSILDITETSGACYVRGWKFKTLDIYTFDGTTYTAASAAVLAQLGKVVDGILYI